MSDSGKEDSDPLNEYLNEPPKRARTARWVMPNLNDLSQAERSLLQSHDLKLSKTWLEEERTQASAWLNPKPWKQLRSELDTAERVVNYSEAQKQMLRSLETALKYEAEGSWKQETVDWIKEELKNLDTTVRTLKTDIKRLARLTYRHKKAYERDGTLTREGISAMDAAPHWLFSGMNLLIEDFSRAAIALDLLIQGYIQDLQSSYAPVFRAYQVYWKLQEGYLEVARDFYSGTRGQQAELAYTRLQALLDQIWIIMELIQDFPHAEKYMGEYFARRFSEYQLLLDRARANRKPMTLDRFKRYGAQ